MIADSKYYYGAVLTTIFDDAKDACKLQKLDGHGAGFYLLNDKFPIFVKYSTARRSPWLFTFREAHQQSQRLLALNYGECLLAMVCGRDGVAALTYDNLNQILDHKHQHQETIRISRKHNEMYKISGTDGVLDRRVSKNSLLDLLVQLSAI